MEKLETEFAQIVKEQKDTIYTVCYMFSKDAEEINDLFQEILVNLWKGFSSFRGQSHIKTWVWKVSLNTCISFDRKKRSRAQTIPLKMNINLYKDNDKDSLQIRMLYERVNRLGLFDRAIILLWLKISVMKKSVPSSVYLPKTYPYGFIVSKKNSKKMSNQ